MPDRKAIEKITALWALTEAGLGGLFHAFRMPFTGLIICGLAVIFISLIAKLSDGRYQQVIRATIIVLVIKMLISPHTPPTAYFAVLFQGVLGYALFSVARLSNVTIFLFSTIALLESGYQKVLTLTIFYGLSLWESIDSFYEFIHKQFIFTPDYSGSSLLLMAYTFLYLAAGLFFGYLASRVLHPGKIDKTNLEEDFRQYTIQLSTLPERGKKRYFGRRSWLIIFLFMILGILLLFNPEMGWQKAVYVFVRALIVIILWYTLLAPLAKLFFESFLKKQKKKYAVELEGILSLFPDLKRMVRFSLERQGKIRSFWQFRDFLDDVLYLTLHTGRDEAENSKPVEKE